MCLLFSGSINAQITCDDPLFIIADDIEGYAAGDIDGAAPQWAAWPGGATSGIVNTDFAFSGTQSVKIDGSTGNQDALLLLGDSTSGHYTLRWKMYIPDGNEAYFNMQHEMPTTAAGFWAVDVLFELNGAGRVNLFSRELAFEYTYDEWFDVILFLDIDSDEARLVVGDIEGGATTVAAWPFSNGVTNGGANYPSSGLNGINFYPINANNLFYIDDVVFSEIPAAETGQYCYEAVSISEGVHAVPELDCFGAAYYINEEGLAGYWFEYTATEDGVISVSSCDGGVDSRVWLFDGECHDLRLLGVNDDRCDLGGGDLYASYRETPVTAGSTYYILWDDIWDTAGFDFEVVHTAGDLTAGNFCQSAISVGINEDIFTESFGEAAVAGPNIGNFQSSTTPYAGSAWYSFTPNIDATLDITACAGTVGDTRLWVYTGSCVAIDSLVLVGSDDDGCAAAGPSIISGWEVTAGTTYYIEWDDELSTDAILWRIEFTDAVTYTFNVDMSLETVDAGGVFIAGAFTNWQNLEMDDSDGDNIYSVTTGVPPNADLAYKFKNGPDGWESINTSLGDDCTTGGFGDRGLSTGTADSTLMDVCFSYCVSCQIVDIDEVTLEKSVAIFPNPASDQLFVQLSLEESIDLEVRLLNTLGQVVSNQIMTSVQTETIEMNVSHLSPGTYFVQMVNNEVSISRKVVLQ